MITATATEIQARDLRAGDQVVRHTGRISEPIANLRYSTGTFGSEMVSFDFGVHPDGVIPAIGVRCADDAVTVVRATVVA